MSDPVDYVPFETTVTAPETGADGTPELERLYDVPVELAVEIGRTRQIDRVAGRQAEHEHRGERRQRQHDHD